MFSYQWDWSSYITVFTGQEQLRYWAKLYWRFFLKVFRWTWGWSGTEEPWTDPHLIYPPVQALFLFLGNRFIAFLWKSNMSQGLIQGCLQWVSPCSWESSFPLSLSLFPPLVGGNMVESSSWVLTLGLCQSSRLLGFRILETWQSSLTLADFLTLAGVLGSSCLLFLSLVVFRTLVGLPDSCWSSGLLLVFRTLLATLTSQSLYIFDKIMWFFQRRTYY